MNVQKMKIVPAEKTSRPERLTLEVPRFPRGNQPTAKEMLSPVHNCETDMPFYIDESQILNLTKDEVDFRHAHPDDWSERCWFVLGTIRRASSGILWGMITRIFPAQNIKATSALFEFSAETWGNLRQQMAGTDDLLLGWIHTHSLKSLPTTNSIETEAIPLVNPSSAGEGAHVELNEKNSIDPSGLFLSPADIDSASKKGFSSPYHLTCILDSDASMNSVDSANKEIVLDRLFGVWGWLEEGLLYRRSLYITRT